MSEELKLVQEWDKVFPKSEKVKNISSNELKNILGNGDVTITITLSR